MIIIRSLCNIFKSAYLRDFINFSFGYFLCAFLSLIVTALVNKNLSRYELGAYSYNKSLFELLVSLASLSIYSAYLRFNVNGVNIRLREIIQKYIIIISIILFIIFFFISDSLIASFYCLILFYNERTYYYRSLFKTNKLNILRILTTLTTFILTFSLVSFYKEKLSSSIILFFYAIGYSVSLIFFTIKDKIEVQSEEVPFQTVLKYCVPGALLLLVDWVFVFSSQYIIKQNYGYADLAPFAISQRAMLAVKLITGLYLMFYPTLYFKEFAKKNFSFIRYSRLFIICSLFLCISLCFIGSKYIYILLGADNYIQYQSYFHILLLAEFFKVLASIYGLYLTFKIRALTSLGILSIGTVVNILIIYFFIGKYGIVMACYSAVFAYFVVLCLMLMISYRSELKETNL